MATAAVRPSRTAGRRRRHGTETARLRHGRQPQAPPASARSSGQATGPPSRRLGLLLPLSILAASIWLGRLLGVRTARAGRGPREPTPHRGRHGPCLGHPAPARAAALMPCSLFAAWRCRRRLGAAAARPASPASATTTRARLPAHPGRRRPLRAAGCSTGRASRPCRCRPTGTRPTRETPTTTGSYLRRRRHRSRQARARPPSSRSTGRRSGPSAAPPPIGQPTELCDPDPAALADLRHRRRAALQRHIRRPAAGPVLAGPERAEPEPSSSTPVQQRGKPLSPGLYRALINSLLRRDQSGRPVEPRDRRRPRPDRQSPATRSGRCGSPANCSA